MTRRDDLTLYHFWRSSSSWRVRWALRLKGVECPMVHVDLATGDALAPDYLAKNALAQVPVLEMRGHRFRYLTETVAMLEWLDETVSKPAPLVPKDPMLRARARQLTEIVNANVHVLQNISTFRRHSSDAAEQQAWNHYWVDRGLRAYEQVVAETAGTYSLGDAPTMPDLYLIPLSENALRYEVDLGQFPHITRIVETCKGTEDCRASAPEAYKPADWKEPDAGASGPGR